MIRKLFELLQQRPIELYDNHLVFNLLLKLRKHGVKFYKHYNSFYISYEDLWLRFANSQKHDYETAEQLPPEIAENLRKEFLSYITEKHDINAVIKIFNNLVQFCPGESYKFLTMLEENYFDSVFQSGAIVYKDHDKSYHGYRIAFYIYPTTQTVTIFTTYRDTYDNFNYNNPITFLNSYNVLLKTIMELLIQNL